MLRLDGRTLTYDVFRDACLIPNRPAIISHAASSLFHDRSPTACDVASVPTKEEEKSTAEEAHYLAVMRADLSPTGLLNLFGPEALVPVYRSTEESAFAPDSPCASLSYEECNEVPLREVLLAWASEKGVGEGVRSHIPMQKEGPCAENEWEEEGERTPFRAQDRTPHHAHGSPHTTLMPCTRTLSHVSPNSTGDSFPPCSSIRPTYLKDFHFQRLAEQKCGVHVPQTERITERKENRKENTVSSTLPPSTPSSALSLSWVPRVPHFLGRDWLNEFCRRDTGAWGDLDHRKKEGWGEPTSERHPCGTCDCNARPSSSFHFGLGNSSSDYRFAYIGTPNTATPLHFDVFGSYSWSLNVSGTKLWYFPSPKSNAHLLTYFSSHSMFPLPPDLRVLSETESLCAVVQHPGDLIFVPALYLHQVHNVRGEVFPLPSHFHHVNEEKEEDSPLLRDGHEKKSNGVEKLGKGEGGSVELVISVNHNWCNQYNVESMIQDVFLGQAVRYLSMHASFSELESMGEWILKSQSGLSVDETNAREAADDGEDARKVIRSPTLSFHPSHEVKGVPAGVLSPSFLSGRLAMLSLYVDLVLQQGACWSFRGVVAFLTFCHHQVVEEGRRWNERKKEAHDRDSESGNHPDDEGDRRDEVGGGTFVPSTPQRRAGQSEKIPSNECEERDRSEELARADDQISHLLLRVYKAWEEMLRQIQDA